MDGGKAWEQAYAELPLMTHMAALNCQLFVYKDSLVTNNDLPQHYIALQDTYHCHHA